MNVQALFVTIALASGVASAQSISQASPQEMIEQAKAAYADRSYSEDGVKKAKESADLYAKAAALLTGSDLALAYIGQADSLFFAGSATPDSSKEDKIANHLAGIQAADKALQVFAVNDVKELFVADGIEKLKSRLNAAELSVVARAIYSRGTNLGNWGTANGVVESLGKWPELRDSMQSIINLGFKDVSDYGPYRVLGRGYFKIPSLLGGSMKKARKYLAEASKSTIAAGSTLSRNAHNNLYLAEVLHEDNAEDEAKALLQTLIAEDAAKLNPQMVPETKDAQKQAAELLKNW